MDSVTRQLSALVNTLLARVEELEDSTEFSAKDIEAIQDRNHELRNQVDDANEQCNELRRQITNWENSYNALREQYNAYVIKKIRGNDLLMSEIRDLIQTKGMIPAIKHLRSLSPFGLKEAKDFCDELVAEEKLTKAQYSY